MLFFVVWIIYCNWYVADILVTSVSIPVLSANIPTNLTPKLSFSSMHSSDIDFALFLSAVHLGSTVNEDICFV